MRGRCLHPGSHDQHQIDQALALVRPDLGRVHGLPVELEAGLLTLIETQLEQTLVSQGRWCRWGERL